jgi:glutathione S-transferase
MPRPDLRLLNVHYRRIPLMAIGRDVYADTRIILRKLEQLFPDSPLTPPTAEGVAIARLFEIWSQEGGLFMRGSQLIPSDMPLLMDPAFQKDRQDFSGKPWTKENIDKNKPEALVNMRRAFIILEGLLADGRDWVMGTKVPSITDIDGQFLPYSTR